MNFGMSESASASTRWRPEAEFSLPGCSRIGVASGAIRPAELTLGRCLLGRRRGLLRRSPRNGLSRRYCSLRCCRAAAGGLAGRLLGGRLGHLLGSRNISLQVRTCTEAWNSRGLCALTLARTRVAHHPCRARHLLENAKTGDRDLLPSCSLIGDGFHHGVKGLGCFALAAVVVDSNRLNQFSLVHSFPSQCGSKLAGNLGSVRYACRPNAREDRAARQSLCLHILVSCKGKQQPTPS